ncbi:FERM domain-containing protein 1 [Oryzias melastigma]|uniref:FERM domain-containing protein 1 n=1 Tax=Oryzias melastigma TaxID=30732 RepID=A0A834FBW1_ORYME|nr:FERM domain-containing protein 1 [Oryzias melastigma]
MAAKKTRHVCVLLPSKRHLDCTVGVKARGQEVWSSVLRQLGVGDLQVFALAVLRDNEYIFLDLDRKLSKYFCKKLNRESSKVPYILFLRIKFYVESGLLIMSSRVQQLYYAELRQKLLLSQSRGQEVLLFQLAALALQAEVGDHKEASGEEKGGAYIQPEDYFPSWLIKRRGRDFVLQNALKLHAELRGEPSSRAVLRFIKEAGGLQDATLTFYRMRQEKRSRKKSIFLGVAMTGIHIYQEINGIQQILLDFSWNDIDSLTFQGSKFEIMSSGSLCLSKLVYYSPSAFHSKHILMHIRDSHRLHLSTREAASYIQHLEDMEGGSLLCLLLLQTQTLARSLTC